MAGAALQATSMNSPEISRFENRNDIVLPEDGREMTPALKRGAMIADRVIVRLFVGVGVALCALATLGCSGPAGDAAHRPVDAPVSAFGTDRGPALDSEQRAELDAAVAATRAAERPRLRYALARDDSGKNRLAVYDPGPASPPGPHTKTTLVYVVYRLLNAKDGANYDPQQDVIVDALPVPSERDIDAANAPHT